jgi:hypothetical protein
VCRWHSADTPLDFWLGDANVFDANTRCTPSSDCRYDVTAYGDNFLITTNKDDAVEMQLMHVTFFLCCHFDDALVFESHVYAWKCNGTPISVIVQLHVTPIAAAVVACA